MTEATDVVKLLDEKKKILKDFKLQAEATRNSRIRNEANLENLIKSENDIIAKIRKLGYEPENLKSHIEAKLKELNSITDKLAKVMPDEKGVIPSNVMEILSDGKASNDNSFDDISLDDFPF